LKIESNTKCINDPVRMKYHVHIANSGLDARSPREDMLSAAGASGRLAEVPSRQTKATSGVQLKRFRYSIVVCMEGF
jgi:hypothetical protein